MVSEKGGEPGKSSIPGAKRIKCFKKEGLANSIKCIAQRSKRIKALMKSLKLIIRKSMMKT